MNHKICHVTSVHKRNDIRIYFKECKSLAMHGFTVTLIVADGLGHDNMHDIKILDVGKPKNRFFRIFKTQFLIYLMIKKYKFDVVHFHDPELLLMGYKLSKEQFKVIYDVHEDLPKQILSKYWIFKPLRPFVAYCVTFIEKVCSKNFSVVITATQNILKRFITYNHNSHTIYNYPIINEFENINVDWNMRKNVLSYIGSISYARGIEPLIMSLKLSQLNLELAGNISGDLNLTTLEQMNGFEYVNYHRELNRSGIVELLSKVKIGMVTLLPTPSYIDALPIKLFEYMLSGIPVVASNFPLWKEIIESHECGITVDPTNPLEISKACLYLINHQDIAKHMGENGKQAVLKYYNWENEARKLIDIYYLLENN